MIKHLKLANFQRHASLDLDFTPGLNLIVGPNWAGKTTILRAIAYAIGGSSLSDVKAANLIKDGEKDFLVELTFELDKKTYVVTRSKNLTKVTVDGDVKATGQTSVTDFLGEVLGISAKHFQSFYQVRQNEADQLLKLGAAKLSQILNDVTGVDLIERMTDRCKSEITELRWSIETVKQLQLKLEEAQGQLPEMEVYVKSLTDYLESTGPVLQQWETWIENKETEVADLERAFVLAERYKRDADLLKQEVAHLQESLDKLGDLSPVTQADIENANSRLQTLREQQKRQNIEREHKQALGWRITAIEDELQNLQLLPVEIDIDTLHQQKQERERFKAEADAVVNAATQALSSAFCPTCQRAFEDHDPEALEIHLEHTKGDQAAVRANYNEFMVFYRIQSELLAKNTATEQKRTALQDELTAAQHDHNLLNPPDPDLINTEIESQQEHIASLKLNLASYLTKEKEHFALTARLTAAQNKLDILVEPDSLPEESALILLRQELNDGRNTYAQTQRQHTEQLTRHAEWNTKLQTLQSKCSQARDEIENLKPKANRVLQMQALTKFLRSNRDRYLANIWTQITSYTNSFVSEVTGGEITELRRARSGDFVYVENGVERPVELASGMQGAILGVALKLALGAALGGARRLLLIDEATAGASDENSLLFTQLLKNFGGQSLMVTHRSADASVADHVLQL
jgi:DNA repair exonuclease SbcCD ATPase subunit